MYLHFPDLTYKIVFLAQNYSPLIWNNGHPGQGATRSSQRPLESLDEGLNGGIGCAALTTSACLTRHRLSPQTGRTCHQLPLLHLLLFLFLFLLLFLLAMLRWRAAPWSGSSGACCGGASARQSGRTSSGSWTSGRWRASHLTRRGQTERETEKIAALEQLRPEVLLNSNRVFQNLKNIYIYTYVCVCLNNKEEENKGIRTCFTCMNPCVRLKMIWPWKLSLTRLTLKGLHSYTEMHTVAAVTETDVERVQSLCTYTYGARFIKLKKKTRFKR